MHEGGIPAVLAEVQLETIRNIVVLTPIVLLADLLLLTVGLAIASARRRGFIRGG